MDLADLKTQLAAATDDERDALIAHAALEATPSDLVGIAGLLLEEEPAVRLSAVHILARAGFAPAAGALLAVVKNRAGVERAAALVALGSVAQGGDRTRVLAGARPFVDDDDGAVREAARALVAQLAEPGEGPRAGAVIAFGLLSPDREKRRAALVRTLQEHKDAASALASSLLETRSSAVRMDLLAGLGTLGGEALKNASLAILKDADADLVALLSRQLEQKLQGTSLSDRVKVARAVLAAGERVNTPLARAAADACALALAPQLAVQDQATRVGDLDAEDLERLKDALVLLEDESRSLALKALLAGLAKSPARTGAFAELLYADLARLDAQERTALLAVTTRATTLSGDDADLARHLGPLTRLFARLVPRGSALPSQLAIGLRLSPRAADRAALVELCSALGTEEAADCLLQLSERGDEELKARAQDALMSFESDEVEVSAREGSFALLPRYTTPAKERLQSDGRWLVDRDGARWLFAATGALVRELDTPFGGCRCCFRPRALEKLEGGEDKALPTCPISHKRHLIDPMEGTFLEESHPLGACVVCESPRPLVREAERVRCLACHTSYERKGERYLPRRSASQDRGVYVVTGGPAQQSPTIPEMVETPKGPSAQDLSELPAEVRRAMTANVVLAGRGSFRSWGASGIVVARSENELAILTNRHAVEEVTGEHAGARVPLTCYTIAGEEAPTRVVWVAEQGLDLALLCARVADPDAVDVIDLERGRIARPGDEVFAVGNALSLPWSYSSGPVSALRMLPTRQGLDVRFLQTPMNLAAGTGGGGIYLKDGALCGVVSWYRATGSLSETNFAISVDSVVAGLRRERVRFGGAPLCASE